MSAAPEHGGRWTDTGCSVLAEPEHDAANRNGLARVPNYFPMDRTSAHAGYEEQLPATRAVPRHQRWRNAAANAASRAVPMHFTLAGVHHTQIALAVHDFTAKSLAAK